MAVHFGNTPVSESCLLSLKVWRKIPETPNQGFPDQHTTITIWYLHFLRQGTDFSCGL